MHGLDGTVRVVPDRDDVSHLFSEGSLLYLKSRRGELMPARIENARQEGGGRPLFFVKFDRISDRTEAESWRDTAVYSADELPETDDLMDEMPDPTGYRAIDPECPRGEVAEVMDNPAHAILEGHLETERSAERRVGK